MGIEVTRFEHNWKLKFHERWLVKDDTEFHEVVIALRQFNIPFSVEFIKNDQTNIVLRTEKVVASNKLQLEKILGTFLEFKHKYGIVFTN